MKNVKYDTLHEIWKVAYHILANLTVSANVQLSILFVLNTGIIGASQLTLRSCHT